MFENESGPRLQLNGLKLCRSHTIIAAIWFIIGVVCWRANGNIPSYWILTSWGEKKRTGRCWHSSSCFISGSYQDGKRNKLCIQKCQTDENGINHKFNNQVQIITRIFNANYAESDNGEMCVTKKHLRSIRTEAYHNKTHFNESFFIHAHTHNSFATFFSLSSDYSLDSLIPATEVYETFDLNEWKFGRILPLIFHFGL